VYWLLILWGNRILSVLQFIMKLCYFIRMEQQCGGWWWLKVNIQVLHHNTDLSEVPGFSKFSVTIYQSWRHDASEGLYLHYNLWKWHKFYFDVMQYLDIYGCIIFATLRIPSVTPPFLSTHLLKVVLVGCLSGAECVQNPRVLRPTYTSVT